MIRCYLLLKASLRVGKGYGWSGMEYHRMFLSVIWN